MSLGRRWSGDIHELAAGGAQRRAGGELRSDAGLGRGQWLDVGGGSSYRGLIELAAAGVGAGVGPGPQSQYLLDVDIEDPVPPRITGVAGLPPGGATTDDPITSFTVTLSEALEAGTVNAGSRMVWGYGGHFYALTEAAGTWTTAEAQAAALGGTWWRWATRPRGSGSGTPLDGLTTCGSG